VFYGVKGPLSESRPSPSRSARMPTDWWQRWSPERSTSLGWRARGGGHQGGRDWKTRALPSDHSGCRPRGRPGCARPPRQLRRGVGDMSSDSARRRDPDPERLGRTGGAHRRRQLARRPGGARVDGPVGLQRVADADGVARLVYLRDEDGEEERLVLAARAVIDLTHDDADAGEACVLWCVAIRHAVLNGEFDVLWALDLLIPGARRT
jgi:hypothetical protein